jgi:hypothetical protein
MTGAEQAPAEPDTTAAEAPAADAGEQPAASEEEQAG